MAWQQEHLGQYYISCNRSVMNQRKITVNLIWANVFGVILFLVVTILSCSTWYFVWGYPTLDDFRVNSFLGHNAFLAALFILMLFIMGAIVHELIHGITWACFATNKFKSIHYGIIWGVLTPYCHCDEQLTVRQYSIGALMPLFVLGVIPLVLAFPFKSIPLLVWGIMFVSAAAGDILIVWKLRKEPSACLVLDHPKEAGCIIFEE
mgnify:FL=1